MKLDPLNIVVYSIFLIIVFAGLGLWALWDNITGKSYKLSKLKDFAPKPLEKNDFKEMYNDLEKRTCKLEDDVSKMLKEIEEIKKRSK